MFGGAGKRGGLPGVDVPWRRGMVRREMGKEVRAREQGGKYSFGKVYAAEVLWKVGVGEIMLSGGGILGLDESWNDAIVAMVG